MEKTVIIVTGGPGTGKTRMASRLSAELEGMVTLSHDQIKEKNFDQFGFDNKEQKDELNRFSLEEFYLTIRKQMWLSNNILIEYPFYQVHRQRLADLIEEGHYSACTVYLYGDRDVIYRRLVRRDHEDKRHPGHLMNRYHKEDYGPEMLAFDAAPTYRQFCHMMETKNYNIMLGKTITVDVTDLGAVPYQQILDQIRQNDL